MLHLIIEQNPEAATIPSYILFGTKVLQIFFFAFLFFKEVGVLEISNSIFNWNACNFVTLET